MFHCKPQVLLLAKNQCKDIFGAAKAGKTLGIQLISHLIEERKT